MRDGKNEGDKQLANEMHNKEQTEPLEGGEIVHHKHTDASDKISQFSKQEGTGAGRDREC